MRVGIVTVYYTENCGSVLQAVALADKLKEYNCAVKFISTRNELSGHSIKRLLKDCIKAIVERGNVLSVCSRYRDYSRYIKKNFEAYLCKAEDSLDMIMIGSDTVWDVNALYFMKSQEIFWGLKYGEKPIITYAASIANSAYEKLDSLCYPVEALKGYKAISVRDEYTQGYVETRTGREVVCVCDPTLLHDKSYYISKCKFQIKEKYILLYLFDEPEEYVKKEIVDFARGNKLRIIALRGMGKRISFADVIVEATIDNFLAYYHSAQYIITNTFHGTVFSVIFNKKFVVLDYNKKKINGFLEQLEIADRLCSRAVMQRCEQEITYSKVNRKLQEMRTNGEHFLATKLMEWNNGK